MIKVEYKELFKNKRKYDKQATAILKEEKIRKAVAIEKKLKK